MRKIRIFAHISLDGVISPPGDSEYANGGWTMPYRTPAGAAMLAESYGTTYDLLRGRRTYDQRAGFWPKAPSSPVEDGLNPPTKYVAPHRPARRGCARGGCSAAPDDAAGSGDGYGTERARSVAGGVRWPANADCLSLHVEQGRTSPNAV